MNSSPAGSSVHGIFQARLLEWVVLSSSRGFPNPGTEPGSPTSQALFACLSHQGSPLRTALGIKNQQMTKHRKYLPSLSLFLIGYDKEKILETKAMLRIIPSALY